MSIKAWAKVKVAMRSVRTFSYRNVSSSGKEEVVITIPGFTGELKRTMTKEEASKWVNSSNKNAFMAAAKASEGGAYGYEKFGRYGKADNGMSHVVAEIAAKAFSDKKE